MSIVKRSKPPVLTSPWKIGFFVSLMLVVVGSSVTYFFMRETQVAWVAPLWTDWQSVLQNATTGEGMIFRLWPLAAIIGFTSLLSYVAITQAVRKYKSYLDSGLDYKHLLASIREINDLDDESRFETLENHPELREFLTRIRGAIIRRTQELDERETLLEERVRKERETSKRSDVERFDKRAATVPLRPANELRADGSTAHIENIVPQVEKLIEAGRQMERHLSGVTAAGASETPDASAAVRPDMARLSASLDEIKRLSATMNAMGEEARSVAINTAIKAGSGAGTQADLIDLAEDVKDVAAKFGELSKSYMKMSDTAKGCIGAIETGLNRHIDNVGGTAGRQHSIQTASSKVSRCVEDLVMTFAKMKGSPPPSVLLRPERSPEIEVSAVPPNVNEYGFEIMGPRPILSASKEMPFDLQDIQKASDALLSETDTDGDMFADLGATVPPEKVNEEDPNRTERGKRRQVDRSEAPARRRSGKTQEFKLDRHFVDLPPGGGQTETPTVASDHGADVIDLYALGAVDYDPALHN